MKKRSVPAVLIVEDEPLTRMVAADAVSEAGFAAREAGNADEALQLLRGDDQVAILFTDVDMPGTMNGMGLAAKVHEDRPDVELIVTSGAATIKDSDLPDHGTFIPKPYRTARLVEVVKQKLARHED